MEQTFKTLQETFNSGKTIDLAFRKQQLKKFIEMMTSEKPAIEEAVYKDLKKPASDVTLNEISLCINEAKFALANLEGWADIEHVDKKMANLMDTAYIRKDPKGVALIIAPWNFPIQLALTPMVSLIASGCVGIIKPSEISPHSSACIKMLVEKHLDTSCYAVIEGEVKEVTALLKLPFNHIFYTGNTFVGKIIMRAAAEHLATVTLELGGSNPCFVDETVDLKIAAKRIAWLKTNNCGQICLSINYLLIKKELVTPFVAHFEQALVEMFGNDVEKSPDYPRIINTNHFDRISKILNKVHPEDILLGNKTDKSTLYIAPTLVRTTLKESFIKDEIFGPILPIIPVDDFEEGIKFAKSLPKPLGSYTFSHDKKLQEAVLSGVISGTAMINDVLMNMACNSILM